MMKDSINYRTTISYEKLLVIIWRNVKMHKDDLNIIEEWKAKIESVEELLNDSLNMLIHGEYYGQSKRLNYVTVNTMEHTLESLNNDAIYIKGRVYSYFKEKQSLNERSEL